jgi:hypothetical protein
VPSRAAGRSRSAGPPDLRSPAEHASSRNSASTPKTNVTTSIALSTRSTSTFAQLVGGGASSSAIASHTIAVFVMRSWQLARKATLTAYIMPTACAATSV